MSDQPSWTSLMLTPDWWDHVIANWTFGSNLAAELIGLALAFLFGTLVYRLWLKRQRAIPLTLLRTRLERAGRAIIHEAPGRLGVGYWWEWDGWDDGWALVQLLDRLPADDSKAGQTPTTIATSDWLEVAKKIVQEFSDLERSITPYSSVLASQRHLFDAYSLLDDAAHGLKDYVEHLTGPGRNQLPPAAVQLFEQRLTLSVSYAIKATASVYTATHDLASQARVTRLQLAWLKLQLAWLKLCSAFRRPPPPASDKPEDSPT